MVRPGPHREGEEPKPMMHERGKSDSAVRAVKPANKAERSAAELVEQRAGTKGNGISKARAGLRNGKVCHRRWDAYGKPRSKGRRKSSPRSSTTLARLHQLRGLGDAKVLKSLGHGPKGRHYRG